MPYKEHTIRRRYWPISKLSKELSVPASCVRFWEDNFSMHITSIRDHRGHRHFKATDRDRLHHIRHLLKEKRYTIAGALQEIEENGFPMSPPSGEIPTQSGEGDNLNRKRI